MYIEFRSLYLTRFRSVLGTVKWKWQGSQPGLYYITGRNEAEPSLGANGCGKSTLADGLCWTLYGKTSRGLSGPQVSSWGEGGNTIGVVKLRCDDVSPHVIERGWKPNYLKLDGAVVEQHAIDKLLGLTYSMFLHSVLFGQFSRSFLDLSSTEKASMISESLGLDLWLECSRVAKELKDDLSKKLALDEAGIAHLEGEEATLFDMDFSERESEWEESRRRKRIRLFDEVKEDKNKLRKVKKESIDSRCKSKELKGQIAQIRLELSEHRDSRSEMEATLARVNAQVAAKVDTLDYVRGVIVQVKANEGVCNVCGQRLSDQGSSRRLRELSKQQQQVVGELEDCKTRADQESSDLVKLRRVITLLGKELEQVEFDQRKEEERDVAFQVRANRLMDSIEHAAREIDELDRERNPWKEEAAKVADWLESLAEEISEGRSKIDKTARIRDSSDYWVRGFKDVRLFVMGQIIAQLELEVNNVLVELGLPDWLVRFELESETKSGTVKRGFQTLVTSPTSDGPTPWAAWCGGETQRLRLAGIIGMARLISDRVGVSTNLEIWDEATQHLSEEGLDDLLDCLYLRASETDCQIYLIDHRAIDFGSFAGTITVVRDDDGTRIEK